MRYRALKALALVMAVLLMVPGVEALLKVAWPPSKAVAVAEGIDSQALLRVGDPFEALDRLDGVADAGNGDVPAELSEEVGLLPGARDVRVDATGAVLGYVVPGESSAVERLLCDRMKSFGWSAVSLGGVEGATYLKSQGTFTWALVTCTQVDDTTSVVVRCMRS